LIVKLRSQILLNHCMICIAHSLVISLCRSQCIKTLQWNSYYNGSE